MLNAATQKLVALAAERQARMVRTAVSQLTEEKVLTEAQQAAILERLLTLMGVKIG